MFITISIRNKLLPMSLNKSDHSKQDLKVVTHFVKCACLLGCIIVSVITLIIGDHEGETNLFFSFCLIPAGFILASVVGVMFAKAAFSKSSAKDK